MTFRKTVYGLIGCLLGSAAASAWAAGQIEFVAGESAVVNRDGQPRSASRGSRVVEGEAIVTGPDGEVVVVTDDAGVLAVRPQSRLLLEQIAITGTGSDTVWVRLLRGSLRSITGWISKTAPARYRISTPTTTVGIRGTDHETAVDEEGSGGTFHRVTEGATVLGEGAEALAVEAGQFAQAAGGTAPRLVPADLAARFFPRRASDAEVDALSATLAGERDSRLRTRQEQLRRSGGPSPQGNPRISAQCTPDAPAQRAFDNLLRAYEQGNLPFVMQRLDPALIGYGFLINDMQLAQSQQRQVQIRVLDRQMQCGPDLAVIDYTWERRWLESTTFTPQLVTGRGQVLLSGLSRGEAGPWRIAGFNGDNPLRTLAPRPRATQPTPGGTPSPAPAPGTGGTAPAPSPTPAPGPGTPPAPTPPMVAMSTLTASPGAVSLASLPASCTPATVSGVATVATTFNATASMVYGSTCNVPTVSFACTISSPLFPTITTAPYTVQPSCAVPFHTMSHNIPLTYSTSASQPINAQAGTNVTLSVMAPVTTSATFTESAAPLTVTSTAYPVCSGTVSIPARPPVCTPVRGTAPVALQLQDADLATPTATVVATTSTGDSEQLTLSRLAPGMYQLASVPVIRGSGQAVPGNGAIDLPASGGTPITLTLTYLDANGAGNAPASRTATVLFTP